MRDRKLLEGVLQKSVLAFIECHTGSCGSEAKEVHLIYAGTNIDLFADELARENAEMYGIYRGEPEDEEDETEYSEGIEGTPYLFHPDDLGSTHTSAHEILMWLRELKAIFWVEDYTSVIGIDREIISQVMEYDFKSFCELVADNIAGEFSIFEQGENGQTYVTGDEKVDDRRTKEIRLFGKFASYEGWTINELITACRDAKTAETSLDDILGGDLATSENIVKDLIAYIRELEK